MLQETPVFSLHYAGCVSYWKSLLLFENICFEQHEFFRKQSYHNRCRIAGATGVQILPVPTLGSHFKRPVSEIEISYSENWQRVHWNAIRSAYGSSPFFTYYDYLLEPFYTKQYRFLIDFNLQLSVQLMQLLKCKTTFTLTDTFQQDCVADFRNAFPAKKENDSLHWPRYAQVFETRLGFIPNLSIFDLLFNMGPLAVGYLCNSGRDAGKK